MKTTAKIVAAVLLTGIVFWAGRIFEHHALKQGVAESLRKLEGKREALQKRDAEFYNAFVNLSVRTSDIGERVSAAPKAGGIHARGNSVIGIGRRGRFFYYTNKAGAPEILPLEIEIDNNYDEFVRYLKERDLDKAAFRRNFRFIDLIYLEGAKTDYLVVSHHFWHGDRNCFTLRLSRLAVGSFAELPALSASAADWTTLYETAPCLTFKKPGSGAQPYPGHEHGGRMAVAPDGRLLLTVGDFEYDGVHHRAAHAQDRNVDYGKILGIDPERGTRTVVSIGHRNAQGLMVDGAGRIWATEHGPDGGDELNLIVEGANYGWPYAVNGTNYRKKHWPIALKQGRHDGFAGPVFSWLPSIAVSNLIEIRDFSPRWNGDLLVGSLKQNTLYRMRYTEGRIQFAEPIFAGERIRDLDQLGDGTIVLWTDTAKILELKPGGTKEAPVEPIEPDVFAGLEPAARQHARAAIQSCARCHGTGADRPAAGAPPLRGVYGREIASTAFAHYSSALREKGGVWNEETLNAFLADGSAFAPGNRMAYPPIEDPEVRRAVVKYLRTLN